VQENVVRRHNWRRIENLIDDLISIHRMRGFKGFLKKMFVGSKRINEAFTSIAEFESEEPFLNNHKQGIYDGIYSGKKITYFQSYFDDEMEQITYPTKERKQLLNFFESRRTKSIEIYMILISAIIGGVIGTLIGALLTILLSKS